MSLARPPCGTERAAVPESIVGPVGRDARKVFLPLVLTPFERIARGSLSPSGRWVVSLTNSQGVLSFVYRPVR